MLSHGWVWLVSCIDVNPDCFCYGGCTCLGQGLGTGGKRAGENEIGQDGMQHNGGMKYAKPDLSAAAGEQPGVHCHPNRLFTHAQGAGSGVCFLVLPKAIYAVTPALLLGVVFLAGQAYFN